MKNFARAGNRIFDSDGLNFAKNAIDVEKRSLRSWCEKEVRQWI